MKQQRITLGSASGHVWFPWFSGRAPRLFAARMARSLGLPGLYANGAWVNAAKK